ncbi:ethanolamine ammonia-lyase subunit EutC [Marinobacter sp. chi1]|uniref:Ethanolamine ammonia-lyase small subunit n=1 Tax=Marinobacter suaedae TaxID=3057675 RepID=A0ABT8W0A8_9GAMM|nr:ethanolamine ammonia-lyase subunit EutC [Marinobacter sp. chi1]MDO3721616.1 ethanolamine ammonia-lyase subunit EutC [Marinobacter sp. chi1]
MSEAKTPVVANHWRALRRFTDARIGLGRAGVSLPTPELLAFQLAHARARDAVHLPLDVAGLMANLTPAIEKHLSSPPIVLESCAGDRFTYLQRPDLGRQLSDESRARLPSASLDEPVDLAIVIVDGLSSVGVQNTAPSMVGGLLNALEQDNHDWTLAPLTVVEQGRVAIGDEIGARLNARMVVVLIGERPGLSSPDSLGIYLTFGPKGGLTDERRNCISNVRPGGLSAEEACRRLLYLMREARRLKFTGVGLKDRTDDTVIEGGRANKNFLTRRPDTGPGFPL